MEETGQIWETLEQEGTTQGFLDDIQGILNGKCVVLCYHMRYQVNFSFRYSTRRYLEKRTWKQRLARARQNWDPVLPSLAELYMKWKYLTSPSRSPSPMVADPPLPPSNAPPPDDFSFLIEVLDIYDLDVSVTIPCSGDELPIQALLKSGYLGNSPATPSIAISLRTLELFRRVRLRKSSFSVEAFAKVICDLYAVSFCLLQASHID